MSYCLSSNCLHPANPSTSKRCQSCGSQLLLRCRYRVNKALAQGGFGATFLGEDASLPGTPSCVIKQLRPAVDSPEVLQMAGKLFEREAKTLGKVGNHPQVPRLLDYFEENHQFYLVQEYVKGLTLQQEIKQSGPVSEAGVKQFLSEMLPVLQYIHSQQMIHRDIKPANLIRRAEDCKLVLIDFGAVKDQVTLTTTSQSDNTALTAFAVGTPGFAPPEQLAMRPVYASDIYAVGITCIFLLTGKSPKDLDYNSLTGEILWENKVQISDHLKQVLKKMLEGSVRHRYQSADEVFKALAMEPYLDSLANSMATQPSGNKKKPGNKTQFGIPKAPSSPPSGGKSFAEVAAAIRARRAAEASNVQGGAANQQVATKSTATVLQPPGLPGQKPKVSRKLDTDSLLMAYVKGRRDFALHDLSMLDLQKVELLGVSFRSSKLDRTNLQKANLSNSDFSRASLKRTNLKEVNLSKAYLNHADLEGVDLRGADLSYADLTEANLKGVNLCGANLTGAKVSEEQLAQAKTNWVTILPNGKRGLFK
ncbi:MAG: pentapeptide repeat-containing protein [Gloeocapsa sp. UFS-A4-WI-NPMV-4B04]|nr:pentapeptide repeat-containing protein [Gloeocapsa sp. UFS-A4-WI-NPMV-4B04]